MKKKRTRNQTAVKAPPKMNSALAAKISLITTLLAECRETEALTRHKVAGHVADIVRNAKHGDGAKETLANELGWSVDKIAEYESVWDTWSPTQFRKLLKRKSSLGKPLSWTHCVLLAVIDDPAEREAATKEVLLKAMNVRELRAYLAKGEEPELEKKESSARPKLDRAARQLQVAFDHLVGDSTAARKNAQNWCTEACDVLKTLKPSKLTPDLRDQLAEACDLQKALADVCQANAKQLEEYLVMVEQAIAKPQTVAPPKGEVRSTPARKPQPASHANGRMRPVQAAGA